MRQFPLNLISVMSDWNYNLIFPNSNSTFYVCSDLIRLITGFLTTFTGCIRYPINRFLINGSSPNRNMSRIIIHRGIFSRIIPRTFNEISPWTIVRIRRGIVRSTVTPPDRFCGFSCWITSCTRQKKFASSGRI